MKTAQIDEIWNKALELLKEKLPSSSFDAWVVNLVPNSLDGDEYSVRCGHRIAIESLSSHNKVFSDALSEITGKDITFKIVFDDELAKILAKKSQARKKENDEKINKYEHLKQMHSDCKLNLKFNFDNFVVGENSRLAFAGAKAVAENPGKTVYNPLFIYGNSGVGKTHLLQAIGHQVLNSGLKVKYCKCEEFIIDFIDAVAKGYNKGKQYNNTNKMNLLRQKYRTCDILLIDDIQFIEKKEQTQVEIFNTFESLYNSGKQIVFTSDRPPSAISELSDRLKTRFESGLLVDIQPPDIETRMAILQNLAEEENIPLSNDVITFLAEVYNANVRELKGAFNKVLAHYSLSQVEPTIENVKKALNYQENQKNYNAEEIISAVAAYFNVSEDDILGTGRAQKISLARQIAIYLTRKLTKDSLPAIGNIFDRKHSTILYSVETMEKTLKYDTQLKNAVIEIKKGLK